MDTLVSERVKTILINEIDMCALGMLLESHPARPPVLLDTFTPSRREKSSMAFHDLITRLKSLEGLCDHELVIHFFKKQQFQNDVLQQEHEQLAKDIKKALRGTYLPPHLLPSYCHLTPFPQTGPSQRSAWRCSGSASSGWTSS